MDLTIVDKNNQEYTMTISSTFSNKPFQKIEDAKRIFRQLKVNIVE